MIPLSDKDAEDLRRQQLELEDERRKTSITGKSNVRRIQGPVNPGAAKIVEGRNGQYFLISYGKGGGLTSAPLRLSTPAPPPPPGLGTLSAMMREVPGAKKRPETLSAQEMPRTPQQRFIMRVQTQNGMFVDREVEITGTDLSPAERRALARARRAQNNIYFSKGQVIVNGIESPQIKAVLDRIIAGEIPPPPADTANKSMFIEQPKVFSSKISRKKYEDWRFSELQKRYRLFRQGGYPNTYEADGVRITNSLIEAYKKTPTAPRKFEQTIFVFGSNTQGRHGKGAALTAVKQHGAVYGRAEGFQGSSYAIPTKDLTKPKGQQSLPLSQIRKSVEKLLDTARKNPSINFNVTAIGTGLAGYKPSDIAPMFADSPPNVTLPPQFKLPEPLAGTKEAAQTRLRELEQTKKNIGLSAMPKEEQIEYKKLKKYLGKATTLLDLPEQETATKAKLGYAEQETMDLLDDVDESVSKKVPKKIDSFRGEYKFLSNFQDSPIKRPDGAGGSITYRNAEAAFQAEKTTDPKIRKQFANLSGPEAKALGRKIKLRPDWGQVRWKIMREIVLTKFQQNETLRNKLLATGDADLVEGNTWGDKYWGVDKSTGEGKNNLGRILMEVRKSLRPVPFGPPADDMPEPQEKTEPKVKIRYATRDKAPGLFVLQDESTALVERKRLDDLNQPDKGSARGQSLGKREYVYNKELTNNAFRIIDRMSTDEKFAKQIEKQGGVRIGKFFVSVKDLSELKQSRLLHQHFTRTGGMIPDISQPGGFARGMLSGAVLDPAGFGGSPLFNIK